MKSKKITYIDTLGQILHEYRILVFYGNISYSKIFPINYRHEHSIIVFFYDKIPQEIFSSGH